MNIIAYGSLQNKESLEKTLGRLVRYELVNVLGYQRIFNAPFGDYSFLNLIPDPNSSFNCLSFAITPDELSCFDVREAGSRLLEVKPGYFAFIWPTEKCADLPVLQSYTNFCEQAAAKYSLDIWESTLMPTLIINDLSSPLY